jgi:hypothetical protein
MGTPLMESIGRKSSVLTKTLLLFTMLAFAFAFSGVFVQTVEAARSARSVSVSQQNGTVTYGTGGPVIYSVTVDSRGSGSGSSTLSISGLPAGLTGTFNPATVDFSNAVPSPTSTLTVTTLSTSNAGSTIFTVQAGGGSNPTNTGTLTINKADQATLTVLGPASVTYGSTGTITTSGGSGTGAMSYNHDSSTGCTVNTLTGVITVTNASGTCTVTATKAADTNYNQATSTGFSVTLDRANSSITVTGSTTFIYNGTPQGPDTANVSGSSGAVTYNYSGAGSTTYGPSSTKPTNVGTYSVTATVAADYNYNSASSSPTGLTIEADTTEPLSITTPSPLPSGDLDLAYSETLEATGGSLPYSWTISSGNLPNGLTLNASTGLISGMPAGTGIFDFTVMITDAGDSNAYKNLSITILSYPVRISSPHSYYLNIQGAYDACFDGGIIQIGAAECTEDIYCDKDLSITLKGGYDSDYSNNSSYTVIHGTLTITRGTVEVDRLVIN